MIKTYCDVCENEVQQNCVSHRLILAKGNLMIEITVGFDGAWNHGAICQSCLLEAIADAKEVKNGK